jgi:hypothetical protein
VVSGHVGSVAEGRSGGKGERSLGD